MNALRTVSILHKTLSQTGEKRCTQALASTAEMVLDYFSAVFLIFLGSLNPTSEPCVYEKACKHVGAKWRWQHSEGFSICLRGCSGSSLLR